MLASVGRILPGQLSRPQHVMEVCSRHLGFFPRVSGLWIGVGEKPILLRMKYSVGLTASGRPGARRRRLGAVIIPVVALVSILLVLGFSLNLFGGPPVAMNYLLELSIQVTDPKNTTQTHFVIPPPAGSPSTPWATNQYATLGINDYYPVYMDPPANPYRGFSVIHVKSLTAHNFTLGDLFAVWGQPLGQNDAVGFQAESPSVSWSMCVGVGANTLTPGLWAQQPLVADTVILLSYDHACL